MTAIRSEREYFMVVLEFPVKNRQCHFAATAISTNSSDSDPYRPMLSRSTGDVTQAFMR